MVVVSFACIHDPALLKHSPHINKQSQSKYINTLPYDSAHTHTLSMFMRTAIVLVQLCLIDQ